MSLREKILASAPHPLSLVERIKRTVGKGFIRPAGHENVPGPLVPREELIEALLAAYAELPVALSLEDVQSELHSIVRGAASTEDGIHRLISRIEDEGFTRSQVRELLIRVANEAS